MLSSNDRLALYDGEIQDHRIEILIGHEGRTCYMRATHLPSNTVRRDGIYPNARSLSADLRSTLGLSVAADWLRGQGVPLPSELYDLNHDGADVRAYFTRTSEPMTRPV